MRKTVSIILKTVTTVLVALAVLIAVLLVGMRVFGFHVYTVLSGSMEPNYHVGSLVYVKEASVDELKEGDVITFMLKSESDIATHRIVEVVPDEKDPGVIRYRTKGDANNVEDATLTRYENVIGKVVFTIPYMGYLANYIQHPPGIYVAIVVAAALVMLVFCADGLTEKKTDSKNGSLTVEGAASEAEVPPAQVSEGENGENTPIAPAAEDGSQNKE